MFLEISRPVSAGGTRGVQRCASGQLPDAARPPPGRSGSCGWTRPVECLRRSAIIGRLLSQARRPRWLVAGPPEGVVHPGLPSALLVAQPPGHRDRAVRARLDLPLRIKLVLEARRTNEGEPALGHHALIAVALLGEGSVVAEEDDPEPPGLRVVAPVGHPALGRLLAEGRLVLLDQEVAAVQPAEPLGAGDRDAGTGHAVPGVPLGRPGADQRLQPPEFGIRRRDVEPCLSRPVCHRRRSSLDRPPAIALTGYNRDATPNSSPDR